MKKILILAGLAAAMLGITSDASAQRRQTIVAANGSVVIHERAGLFGLRERTTVVNAGVPGFVPAASVAVTERRGLLAPRTHATIINTPAAIVAAPIHVHSTQRLLAVHHVPAAITYSQPAAIVQYQAVSNVRLQLNQLNTYHVPVSTPANVTYSQPQVEYVEAPPAQVQQVQYVQAPAPVRQVQYVQEPVQCVQQVQQVQYIAAPVCPAPLITTYVQPAPVRVQYYQQSYRAVVPVRLAITGSSCY